jgi:hypothetical protein
MLFSERTANINRVAEKMFLDLESREVKILSSMEWDDLIYHLQNKYGESFASIFEEILIDVLAKSGEVKIDE